MPIINFTNENKQVEINAGENLRLAMKKAGISPYDGIKNFLNCYGNGFCSSCAVEVVENKGASARKEEEEDTLISETPFYARKVEKFHRLSCQVSVTGDMTVKTHPKFEIDKETTRLMLIKSGISAGFIILLGLILVVIFLDMIKTI